MAVLLDTCALIWMAGGMLEPAIVARLQPEIQAGEAFFSPVSAWEIGMLGRPRPDGPRVRFDVDPAAWFERLRITSGLREARLSWEVAVAAAMLPVDIHADPADRFLIACARHGRMPIMTGDRKIIAYGTKGFLDVIACRPTPGLFS